MLISNRAIVLSAALSGLYSGYSGELKTQSEQQAPSGSEALPPERKFQMPEETKHKVVEKNGPEEPTQPAVEEGHLTRREFVGGTVACVGTLCLGQAAASSGESTAKGASIPVPDASALRRVVKGQVLGSSDPDFEKVALDVWNKLQTDRRRPQLIVQSG